MSRPLRQRVRERLPMGLRLGVRRAPALVRWAVRPPPALPRQAAPLPWTVARRSSPLRRQGAAYDAALQAGKEANVRRVVAALDGVLLPPGTTLSWHAAVGPPLRARGFRPGPELHDGRLAVAGGGGACQVANLLFWLGVHGGLEVVERHRHGLDLFPDRGRTVPFGAGATVSWPRADLRLRNPHEGAARLSLRVAEGRLHGALELEEPLEHEVSLEERGHRFRREAAGGVRRENELWRIWRDEAGAVVREERLAAHSARVCYEVDAVLLEDDPRGERP